MLSQQMVINNRNSAKPTKIKSKSSPCEWKTPTRSSVLLMVEKPRDPLLTESEDLPPVVMKLLPQLEPLNIGTTKISKLAIMLRQPNVFQVLKRNWKKANLKSENCAQM